MLMILPGRSSLEYLSSIILLSCGMCAYTAPMGTSALEYPAPVDRLALPTITPEPARTQSKIAYMNIRIPTDCVEILPSIWFAFARAHYENTFSLPSSPCLEHIFPVFNFIAHCTSLLSSEMPTGSSNHNILARPTKRKRANTTKLDDQASAPRAPVRFSLDSFRIERIERGRRNVIRLSHAHHARAWLERTFIDDMDIVEADPTAPRQGIREVTCEAKPPVNTHGEEETLRGSKKLSSSMKGATSTANVEAHEEIRRNSRVQYFDTCECGCRTWFCRKLPAASVPSISLLNTSRYDILFRAQNREASSEDQGQGHESDGLVWQHLKAEMGTPNPWVITTGKTSAPLPHPCHSVPRKRPPEIREGQDAPQL
ncbi:hypothetical protein D9613_010551 [Agrocybe pediades]|uniref:Uncharacterized protein n=1 Tax=Agrocybe pediades TaxID=84607 RepID=A0A8H4VI37_9AGAR|nr:hypothetical protein D9613_010551 [Agrocybe pediades]